MIQGKPLNRAQNLSTESTYCKEEKCSIISNRLYDKNKLYRMKILINHNVKMKNCESEKKELLNLTRRFRCSRVLRIKSALFLLITIIPPFIRLINFLCEPSVSTSELVKPKWRFYHF